MMKVVTILAILVQSVVPHRPVTDNLVISLHDGRVRGTTYTTDNNKTYYAFQGIPYATPPIGKLRFEAPKPARPWRGIRDATKDGNACLSAVHDYYQDESEDCLYVNVYTTSLRPVKKLPVMIWIHGGSFLYGSNRKTEYGPEFLIEEDIVFVAMNYRLGPFGFLSTGDGAIPGNAGLKDQALAIKWTHYNIAHFGGDPEKITIFGESGGGTSSALHILNKKAKGFFRAAILQSGTALNPFTIDFNPKSYVDLLTSKLGGDSHLNNTTKIKAFLQEKSAEDIIQVANTLGKDENDTNFSLPPIQSWPVIEGCNEDAFLTESPYVLLESGRFNRVPIMIGICSNEALGVLLNLNNTLKWALLYDNTSAIIPPSLRQDFKNNATVIEAIKKLYLKEDETFLSNLVAMTSYHSDTWFVRGSIKHAELATKYIPVYFYQFSYYGRVRYPFVVDGAEKAGHGAELPFLFKMDISNTTDPADILIQNRSVRLWANFAKYLNPTPKTSELIDVLWPAMDTTTLQFYNINSTLEVRSPIRGDTYKGWNVIFDTYGKKPYVTY